MLLPLLLAGVGVAGDSSSRVLLIRSLVCFIVILVQFIGSVLCFFSMFFIFIVLDFIIFSFEYV